MSHSLGKEGNKWIFLNVDYVLVIEQIVPFKLEYFLSIPLKGCFVIIVVHNSDPLLLYFCFKFYVYLFLLFYYASSIRLYMCA